jgi:DNA relaxase NicK
MHDAKVLQGEHAIVSAGVDWLTCTAPRRDEEKPLYMLALELIESEKAAGNEVKKFSLAGYHGYGSGGARYGVRQDSVILQLSGECARSQWRRAKEQARNVSRLDVQVTVAFESPQPYIIKTLHNDSLQHKSVNGRPSNRTLITSTMTGDTLMIGKRQSDVYLRAYDKGIESKCAPVGVLLRYEAEFKRERCARTAARLSTCEDEATHSAALIHTAFVRQGVRVASETRQWQWDSLSLPRSSTEQKLLWLRSAVRPSIAFLLSRVGRDEVLSALGLLNEDGAQRH